MLRIYNIIPGTPVYENSIMDNIFTLIDSVKFNNWIEVNEDIYNCNLFKRAKQRECNQCTPCLCSNL